MDTPYIHFSRPRGGVYMVRVENNKY